MKKFFTSAKTNWFYISLLLFTFSLPLSEFMVSVSAGLVFLSATIEDSFKNKLIRLKERKVLLLLPAVFILYLISAIFTKDLNTALYDIKKALFFLMLPLGFLIGKNISSGQKQKLLIVFVCSVLISGIYSFLNWIIDPTITSLYAAGLISHIRFSFQLILAIGIVLFALYYNYSILKKLVFPVAFISILLFIFLFFQESLTGIIAFGFSVFILALVIIFNSSGKRKLLFSIYLFVFLLIPVGYVVTVIYQFYDFEKIDQNNLPVKTARGNFYEHNLNSKWVENGHYVYLFVCDIEIREEWNKISEIKFDSLDHNGYSIGATLKRYLTSMGVTKDAEGVAMLSKTDIANIEHGMSNYLFHKKKYSLFPRIYTTIWEYHIYTNTGYANNQSFAQRIEFLKAAKQIVSENFWFGVGTGNWKKAFSESFKKNSQLSQQYYASSHNQYFNYLVKFGFIGFILIMFFLVYPIISTKRYNDLLFILFLAFIFISNFSDSNFESHMGSSFFIFFYCLFAFTDGVNYLIITPTFNNKIQPS